MIGLPRYPWCSSADAESERSGSVRRCEFWRYSVQSLITYGPMLAILVGRFVSGKFLLCHPPGCAWRCFPSYFYGPVTFVVNFQGAARGIPPPTLPLPGMEMNKIRGPCAVRTRLGNG